MKPAPFVHILLFDLLQRSFLLASGAAIGRLLPVGVLMAAQRHMDSRQFASVSAAFAWAGIAMSVTTAGYAMVMTQQLSATADKLRQGALIARHLRHSALGSVLLATAVLALGEHGARALYGSALDAAVILPAAVAGALWSQVTLGIAACNGCHLTRAASILLASCGLLQGCGLAVGILISSAASAGAAAWGLCLGCAAASATSWVLRRTLLPSANGAPTGASEPGNAWRNPVVWNTIASASTLPVGLFASSVIARGPDGTRQLAQYFALEQVHQVLVYLPSIVGQALLPIVSRQIAGATGAAPARCLRRKLALLGLVAGLAGASLALLLTVNVGWLLPLLGHRWSDDSDSGYPWALRWMLLNASLGLGLAVVGGAYQGIGRLVGAGMLNLGWGATFLTLTSLWQADGNSGLQAARFVASSALLTVAALALTPAARAGEK